MQFQSFEFQSFKYVNMPSSIPQKKRKSQFLKLETRNWKVHSPSSASFVAESFNWIDRRGAARGIQRCTNRDGTEQTRGNKA